MKAFMATASTRIWNVISLTKTYNDYDYEDILFSFRLKMLGLDKENRVNKC